MNVRFGSKFFLALLLLIIAGCRPAETPSAGPTPLPSPTARVEPTQAPSATREPTQAPTPLPAPATRGPTGGPRLGTAQKDVTYCTASGVPLKMDLYPPKQGGDGPTPVIVYVHGGSWQTGDKASGEVLLEVPELTARGYLVASLNYRLAPAHKWPAQIQDVKCAVRYLRANAAAYHLDPARAGAIGASAGGHLAALLGLTDKSAGFDVGEHLDQSSRVQAVVDLFGPADLTVAGMPARQAKTMEVVFGATSPQDPVLAGASPVTYIAAGAPPFLIIHGDKDTTVPPRQSQEFYRRLQAAGVTATLVMVKNAEHGLQPAGGPISPSEPELLKMTADFFDKYLKSQ